LGKTSIQHKESVKSWNNNEGIEAQAKLRQEAMIE
jgi:hypothetical protein